MKQPYADAGIADLYQLLFCDDLELYRRSAAGAAGYPWDILLADSPDDESLQKIVADDALESRQQLLAARLLTARGVALAQKRLLGVVVEVGMDEGLDVLAAYQDGSARYFNYTGKLIVWETKTEGSNGLISSLLTTAGRVVAQIGVWDQPRRPAPEAGQIRLNFLVTDGLYFGEGPFEVLAQDPLGGPVINAATGLMQFLIGQTQK